MEEKMNDSRTSKRAMENRPGLIYSKLPSHIRRSRALVDVKENNLQISVDGRRQMKEKMSETSFSLKKSSVEDVKKKKDSRASVDGKMQPFPRWTERCKRRRREEKGTPFLVCARMIDGNGSKPGLFIDDTDAHSPLLLGRDDLKSRNVVFDYGRRSDMYSASCRDLVCFYGGRNVYVYSPSTNHYLHLHNPTVLHSFEFEVAIVYMSDLDVYKIVLLEVLPGYRAKMLREVPSPHNKSLRFKAITVPEEGHGGGGGFQEGWEVIHEHALPPNPNLNTGHLGNLIGVNGVVYACITFSEPQYDDTGPRKREAKVISLDLKDDDFAHPRFQILSLPPCCDDDKTTCYILCKYRILSRVKDLLCFPHATTSSVDLWLLKDRNSCSWFKGYTLTCNIPLDGPVGRVVYFPPPKTKTADDDDHGGGLFLFDSATKLFQHDLRTQETVCILENRSRRNFLVVDDRQFFLKNGLECNSLPTHDIHPKPTKVPPPRSHPKPTKVPPLPKGVPPQPQYSQGVLLPPYPSCPPLPQHSLPPPPPPPSYSCPPLPQGSIPPPPYHHHSPPHMA